MSREAHVRFFEGLGVKFPWPTRLVSSGQGGYYRIELNRPFLKAGPKLDTQWAV